ncbi:MAG: hypothetical protein Q7R77_03395 [Candidatus Daviesbacteria bacterium]|nr:hypothetical protein [Candidatus Daviesbacteria bacterium]
MPIQTGLFDSFDNLDNISAESLIPWLKPVPELKRIENYLANKILYPQTIAQTEFEMQMDLSLLREALKMNAPKVKNAMLGGNPFINITLRKLMIPAKFLSFVPDLPTLAAVFIDALLQDRPKQDFFADLWTIVLTDDAYEIVGSVVMPQFSEGGLMNLSVSGKKYEIKSGVFNIIACPKDRCEISYKIQKGSFLGKNESTVEIAGGKLGLIVDGRRR